MAIRVNKSSSRLELSEYFVFGEICLRDIFEWLLLDANLSKREKRSRKWLIEAMKNFSKERKGSMVLELN